MEKRAFEQTGLVPRSIIRTFDRFRRQLLKGADASVIQEFRVSRYQVLVSVKCLVSLLIIPLVVNFLAKTFFLMPLTEYLWNTQQNEIFLNLYQENRAFSELHDFEEKLFFESLIETQSAPEKGALASILENEKFHKTEVKNSTNILYKSLLTSKTLRNDVSSNLNDATSLQTRDTKNYDFLSRFGLNLPQKPKKLLTENNLHINLLFKPKKSSLTKAETKTGLQTTNLDKPKVCLRFVSDLYALEKPRFCLKFLSEKSVNNRNSIAEIEQTKNLASFAVECLEKTNFIKEKNNFTKDSFSSENPRSSSGNYLFSGVEPSKQAQLIHSLPLSIISEKDSRNKPCIPSVCLSATIEDGSFYLENSLPQKFQQKTIELAVYYNQQSIEAITNLFGDFITFITISFLFIWMEPQIIILKSFLTESIYSLSDTTKSFLLILLTDLLVGFHSPRGWEIFIELILRHFGLPENQDFIFLFVATFPVLLDTVFKYWIFRYLNQISPSTVATYHSMIE